jgi:hypothetical protein
MSTSSRFLSYAGMVSESPILGAEVLLLILCRTAKCGRIPSIFRARNPLSGIYIGGHLPQSDHSPGVKLLRDVKVRRQPKELGKLSKLYVEPLVICHPHKDFLFLIKEESGVELCDDLLVPVVAKRQKVRDAMKFTYFQNPVKGDVLLALHVVQVYPLHRDNWPSLLVEHGVVLVLLKESLEVLIGAPFLG